MGAWVTEAATGACVVADVAASSVTGAEVAGAEVAGAWAVAIGAPVATSGCSGWAGGAGSAGGCTDTVSDVEGMLAVTDAGATLSVAGPDCGTVTVVGVGGTDTAVETDGTWTVTACAAVAASSDGPAVT